MMKRIAVRFLDWPAMGMFCQKLVRHSFCSVAPFLVPQGLAQGLGWVPSILSRKLLPWLGNHGETE
jgi:hypothetical protein